MPMGKNPQSNMGMLARNLSDKIIFRVEMYTTQISYPNDFLMEKNSL